jgi:hypothetical protein
MIQKLLSQLQSSLGHDVRLIAKDDKRSQPLDLLEPMEGLFDVGSLDLNVSLVINHTRIASFRIFDLPPQAVAGWISEIGLTKTGSEDLIIKLFIEICRLFGFVYILIEAGGMHGDSEYLVKNGFKRLQNSRLNTVIFYLNLDTDEDRLVKSLNRK